MLFTTPQSCLPSACSGSRISPAYIGLAQISSLEDDLPRLTTSEGRTTHICGVPQPANQARHHNDVHERQSHRLGRPLEVLVSVLVQLYVENQHSFRRSFAEHARYHLSRPGSVLSAAPIISI